MKQLLRILALSSVSILTSIPSHAVQWVTSNGQSCARVCTDARSTPIISGFYSKNNNPFYVCRADARNEGNRAGYNLEPSWSNVCTVGWGNKEEKINPPFDCLCN